MRQFALSAPDSAAPPAAVIPNGGVAMREQLNRSLRDAMRAKDLVAVRTLRLILAAVRDRDIAARGRGEAAISDVDILDLLAKMVRQREEATALYREGGRTDLAEQELAEIGVIRMFMPSALDPEAQKAAVASVVDELGAKGMRDMGRVMAELRRRYAGRMDFRSASQAVKDALAA